MTQERNVYVYVLKYRNEVVYIGTTNSPTRRIEEHCQDEKIFDDAEYWDPMIKDEARNLERRLLAEYKATHGRNPKYNKGSGG